MSSPSRFVRSDAVLSRTVEGETLLLRPGSDSVLLLKGSGPEIWNLLRRPMTIDGLVGALAERYRLPELEIRDDVRAVVASLLDGQLLRELAA